MNVLDSLVEGMMALPDPKDQQHYAWALLTYLASGELPEGLRPVANAMLVANKPALDNSRARAKAGAVGGSKRQAKAKQNASKSEANAKQKPSKPEANPEAEAKQTAKQTPREKEKELLKETSPIGEEKKTRPRFAPPTVSDVRAYAAEKGLAIDAEHFVDYYASNGWKVGRNPMRDWRATVRNWARNEGVKANGHQASAAAAYLDATVEYV